MSIFGGPDIETDGLVLHLDVANTKSFSQSETLAVECMIVAGVEVVVDMLTLEEAWQEDCCTDL